MSQVFRTANSCSTVRCTSDSHPLYCGFSRRIVKNFSWKALCYSKTICWNSHQPNSTLAAYCAGSRPWLTLTQSTVSSVMEPVGRDGGIIGGNIAAVAVGVSLDAASPLWSKNEWRHSLSVETHSREWKLLSASLLIYSPGWRLKLIQLTTGKLVLTRSSFFSNLSTIRQSLNTWMKKKTHTH